MARQSYAPYTNCPAGVVIETSSGQLFTGRLLESAAYNPTLSPVLVALINLWAALGDTHHIARIVMVEGEQALVSHQSVLEMMGREIFPANVHLARYVAMDTSVPLSPD